MAKSADVEVAGPYNVGYMFLESQSAVQLEPGRVSGTVTSHPATEAATGRLS